MTAECEAAGLGIEEIAYAYASAIARNVLPPLVASGGLLYRLPTLPTPAFSAKGRPSRGIASILA